MDGNTVASPASPIRFGRYAVPLIGLAWFLQAYVIWSCTYPPLIDLPNHMARHHLEAVKWSGGEIGPYYELEYRLVPNLGADFVVPFLIMLLGPYLACKVFLTFAVFLYWLGPAWFIAQQGSYRPSTLAAALLLLPFSFSGQFYWGFLNYYSGFGLAFLVLVHFSWLYRQDKPPLSQFVLHILLVTLLFLWHLALWTIYGAVMGCLLIAGAIQRYKKDRSLGPVPPKLLLFCLPLLPGMILFACYSLGNEVGVNPAAKYVWGDWSRKLLLPIGLFRSYDLTADILVIGIWLAAILVWFGGSMLREWSWRPIHLCLAVLTIFFLVLPFQLGGTSDADGRLLPAILVCAVALLCPVPVQYYRWGALLLGLCLVLRFGSVHYSWSQFAENQETHAQAFTQVEPHSRVMPVILTPEPSKNYAERHFLSWVILSKNVLVPEQFSGRDQSILRILAPTPSYVRRHDQWAEILDGPIREHYDYVWIYNPAGQEVAIPESFECVFSATSVSLWRVQPTAQVTTLARP